MSGLDLVCFDADDTLWHNLIHFEQGEKAFAEMMSAYVPAEMAIAKLGAAQVRNIPVFGYGVKTFVLSMIDTAIEISDSRIGSDAILKLIERGRSMATHDIELLPHAEDVLKALHGKYKLLLITMGDLHHQEQKVLASGLAHYFEGVEIVSDKKPAAYSKICKRYGGRVENCLMAGNSLRSDIMPMIRAGGHGVYVPFEIKWAHGHEDVPPGTPRFHEVADLRGVLDVVKSI